MQNKLEFVTGGSKVYRLAGNNWYAVTQDNDKVMLVDTDCKIAGEELDPYGCVDCAYADGENGQRILNYTNSIADKYFNNIKYAIEPRTVKADTGELENAYMWPMSKEEFEDHEDIGGKICKKIRGLVRTRTFIGNDIVWHVYDAKGALVNDNVCFAYSVAPAFYLRKSAIDHISEDGEIVLKPAITD